MYQCLNVSQNKITIEKDPPKHNSRYNLRIQRALALIKILNKKFNQLLRTIDPLASSTWKTQSKSKKIATRKDSSMSSKIQDTPPDRTNTSLPRENSVSLLALDYNIVEDMKKTRGNISLYELTKLMD